MENTKIEAVDFQKDIIYFPYRVLKAMYFDEPIYFLEYEPYVGPVTMQYLPDGGIQSLYAGFIIVKVHNGFMKVTKLYYQNQSFTSQEFNLKYPNLMNQVFQNGTL